MSTIVIDHLARVEGHGGITVELEGDAVKNVRFDVFEGARLLEAWCADAATTKLRPSSRASARSARRRIA